MKGIIYKATCNHDGRVYIGQTIGGLKARRQRHISDAHRPSDHNAFHFALAAYNYDFTWDVLEEFEGDEEYVRHALNVAEEYHILKYKSTDEKYGFNSTYGGYSSDKFAKHFLDRTRDFRNGTPPKGYWQYDLDGNYIRSFKSLREIVAVFDMPRMRGEVLKEDGQWRGYQWRRIRGENNPPKKIKKYEKPIGMCQKVLQYSLSGEFIAIFESISQAHEVTGDGITLINYMLDGILPMKRPQFQWRRYTDNFPQDIGPIQLKPKKGDMVKRKRGRGRPRKIGYTPGQQTLF